MSPWSLKIRFASRVVHVCWIWVIFSRPIQAIVRATMFKTVNLEVTRRKQEILQHPNIMPVAVVPESLFWDMELF